tara:strand:- start:373 stop:702 length:330 start_codon:yes stop_codon:yes gene_type:complete
MDKKITVDHLQPLNEPVTKKKLAYYQQPWWKGRTHVMDLPSVPLNIEEVKDGKVTSRIIQSEKPLTMDDWSKMHSDAITNADKKLKAEWDEKRKEKTTLKRLFKEIMND